MNTLDENRKKELDLLKASPLFNLSLSSKELFHSNFLAWLCEQYPTQAGQIFSRYLKNGSETHAVKEVLREYRNIDLTLRFSNGETLIIENKVKSLPNIDQLKAYSDNTMEDKTKTSFLLLSLFKSPQALPMGWKYLSYKELAEQLKTATPSLVIPNPYHALLLEDYISFISQLHTLCQRFQIDWQLTPDFFYSSKEHHELKDIRIHDLVDKMRYAQLANQVAEELGKKPYDIWRGPIKYLSTPGQIAISSGMTNATGLFDLKYALIEKEREKEREKEGRFILLGVQIQGSQFRLVFEWGQGKGENQKIADQILAANLWFDFSLMPEGATEDMEYPKKGGFNKFGEEFLYRYKKLTTITPKELVQFIIRYADHIHDKREDIIQIIEKAIN